MLIYLPSAKEKVSEVLSPQLEAKDVSNPNVIIQVFEIKRKDKGSRAQVLCTLRNEVLVG